MAKQSIGIGTSADDGTGDSLRTGGDKINDNFDELYTKLGDGSTLTADTVTLNSATQTLASKTLTAPTLTGAVNVTGTFVFEGATDDANETTLQVEDPSTDRTLTLPDEDGKLSTQGFSMAVSIALGGG